MINKYKKEADYSYSLGTELTLELLIRHPDKVLNVFVSSKQKNNPVFERIVSLCKEENIPLEYNDKQISKLSDKENCYIVGVFKKFQQEIDPANKHVVLVNPGNTGNLGTIIRTSVAFGINDIVIITPAVDIFDPRTIRASMGAFFEVRFSLFDSFEKYLQSVKKRPIFPFMLDGAIGLDEVVKPENYSLVFGNEATGLPAEFQHYGQSVLIKILNTVDSLNLCNAVSIALYEFTKARVGEGYREL